MRNIIYLNEKAVNEELITHLGGELEETIQKVNRNFGVGGEIGGEAGDPTGLLGRLKGAISANYSSHSGSMGVFRYPVFECSTPGIRNWFFL